MNVGLVVPGFSADAADWCIPALRHLARSLATTENVRVIAARYPYRSAQYQIDGAEVFAIGGAQRRGSATAWVWRRTLQALREQHRRRPFDVIHGFWATESGLLAALAGRFLNVPTLVSLAGGELVALRDIAYGDQRAAWERLKVAASLRLTTAVSAGSRQLVDRASRRINRTRLHLAPLGVETDLFTPNGASDGKERFVHVGTLTRVKDQTTLLRAFAEVRTVHPRARLEIVGDGPMHGELQAIAQGLGLETDVCFRGEIDHAALPAVYRSAAACIVSSRHEAQCMVALEAAACGVPVVGTRVGVLPEITDAVVPVRDSASLAEAMRRYSSATAMPVECVRSGFGLDACTRRFRALYARLAR